jgi:hypothetical protein
MRIASLLLTVSLLAIQPWPAAGQIGDSASGRPTGPLLPEQRGTAARPPPAALPGLATRRAPPPIPRDEGTANLSPSAALFDAINRGDLAAAREAMARGAELEARNALGLTPIDAAVDQGRNEIAFYLLSARGQARVVGPPEGTPDREPTAAERRRAEQQRRAAELAAGRAALATARGQSEAALRPRLFANDGGAPQPDVGFLGFDAGRPEGAGGPRRLR